ncbi:MAG: hypothetical protein ACT4OH_08175 [Methylophilaceae bacterium]
MLDKQGFKLPLGLLLLDGIGSILVGLGLAIKFGAFELPSALQFAEEGLVLIIIGVLLMLPLLIHLFARARERAEEKKRL